MNRETNQEIKKNYPQTEENNEESMAKPEKIKQENPEEGMSKTEKQDSIRLLSKWRKQIMGFAALWVLCTHEWLLLSEPPGILYEIEHFIKGAGFCGVDIFFLLSGMGLTYAIHKSNVFIFYLNRIKRVMIPFAIVGIVFGTIDKLPAREIARNIFGINFYQVNMYAFLWFVPAVMTFYLFFPLYYALFEKSRNKLFFTVGVIELWLFISMLVSGLLREDLYGMTNRIPVFLIGVFLGWFSKNRTVRFSFSSWLAILMTLILGIYLSYLTNFQGFYLLVPVSNCCVPNILMSVSLSFLIGGFFEAVSHIRIAGKEIVRWIFEKFLGFFGMMSLEFYCVQEWLGAKYLPQMVEAHGKGMANLLLLIVVSGCGLVLHLISAGIQRILNWRPKKKTDAPA